MESVWKVCHFATCHLPLANQSCISGGVEVSVYWKTYRIWLAEWFRVVRVIVDEVGVSADSRLENMSNNPASYYALPCADWDMALFRFAVWRRTIAMSSLSGQTGRRLDIPRSLSVQHLLPPPPRAPAPIENESAPIQLAQCRFPGLVISNARIEIYFSNKKIRKQFYRTSLGNRYGLKLRKCWLQFKKSKFCSVNFWHTFVPYALARGKIPSRLSILLPDPNLNLTLYRHSKTGGKCPDTWRDWSSTPWFV